MLADKDLVLDTQPHAIVFKTGLKQFCSYIVICNLNWKKSELWYSIWDFF